MQPLFSHSSLPIPIHSDGRVPSQKEVRNHSDEELLSKMQLKDINLSTLNEILWPNALKFVKDIFQRLSQDREQVEENTVRSLLARNVRQVYLPRHAQYQILKEEDLAKAFIVNEDMDIYDEQSKKCILKFRKQVLNPEILTRLASHSLMCLPRQHIVDLKRKGTANLSKFSQLFDPTKPHSIEYRKGKILREAKDGVYEVELESVKKFTAHEKEKEKLDKTFLFFPGKIGKIYPQTFKDQSKEELTKAAKYDTNSQFEVGEEVIVPLEKFRFGVYGLAPATMGNPVRLTNDSIGTANHIRLFARSLYFVYLCDLFYKAIYPTSHHTQQEATKSGPRLSDWAFTTFDINLNTASSYHVDHNSKLGEETPFMTALFKIERATKNNCLILPEYNLAVAATTGDFVLFNAEIPHGNPFLKVNPPSQEKRSWGTWAKEINPLSYGCSFIAYYRDSLAGTSLASDKIVYSSLENPFSMISVIGDKRNFEIKLPQDVVFPIPHLPWVTSNDSLTLTRRLVVNLKAYDENRSLHEQLLEHVKRGLALRPQNRSHSTAKAALDNQSLGISITPHIQLLTDNLKDKENVVILDLTLSIALNQVTSTKFNSLFNLELFDTVLWQDIFVLYNAKYLQEKLSGEHGWHLLEKPWIKSAWWCSKMKALSSHLPLETHDPFDDDKTEIDEELHAFKSLGEKISSNTQQDVSSHHLLVEPSPSPVFSSFPSTEDVEMKEAPFSLLPEEIAIDMDIEKEPEMTRKREIPIELPLEQHRMSKRTAHSYPQP